MKEYTYIFEEIFHNMLSIFASLRVSFIVEGNHPTEMAIQLLFCKIFLTYATEFVLFLAVLENSVLPMG